MKIAIMLIIVMLTACSQVTDEQLKQRIIEVNGNLETYSLTTSMEIETATFLTGQPVTIRNSIRSTALIDAQAEMLKVEGSLVTMTGGKSSTAPLHIYLKEGIMYSQVNNMWVKKAVDQDVWRQQDRLAELLRLLGSGTMSRRASERLDDKMFYVIEIHPDLMELARITMKQQGQNEFFDESLDFEDIIKVSSFLAWVDPETYEIERMVIEIEMVLTEENLKIEFEGEEGYLEMRYSTLVEIGGRGDDLRIDLPAPAASAIDLDSLKQNI